MEDLKDRTLTSLGWSGMAQAAQQALWFVVSIILARLLDPFDFGMVGMVVVFTGFAQLFGELGLGAAIIQKAELDRRHLNAVFWVNVAAGMVLTLLFVALARPVAAFYGLPRLAALTAVLAVGFSISSLKIVQNVLLQREMRFKQLALIDITAVLVSGAVAIAMALYGCGVWSLVAQSLLLAGVSAALLWRASPWRPERSFDTAALKELLGFGLNLMGFNTLNYWVRNADKLLIGRALGSWWLGIYTRAYSWMLYPVQQISGVITRVMFPALSSIQHEKERVKSIYLRAIRMIGLVTFPLMLGLLVTARPAVLALLGARWEQVIPILRVLCLTGLGQSVGTTVGWIYASQGRTDIQFKWGLFSGAVYIASIVVGLRWGALGVAVSYTVFGYVVLWYPGWTIPGRLIGLSFAEMLRILAGPFGCAAAMAVAVWFASRLIPPAWSPAAALAVLVPLGAVLYAGLIHGFRIEAYRDLRNLLAERWPRRAARGQP